MSTGGQALGGIAGGVAGFFLSGGNPTGALYGAQFGMMLGGFLDPPKTPTINGPRLTDLTLQTSTYGAVIPRVYGTYAINGNVIWLENNQYQEILTKTRSSGKGGQSKPATRIATYFATFAIGLCAGPIIGVRRIWIGPDLFYDAGSTDPDTIAASNAAAVGFRVYVGSDTQAPDARIQATMGVADTPAWRGLAYIVFDDLPLAAYGNSLMGAQVRVEVFTSGRELPIYQSTRYSLSGKKAIQSPVLIGQQMVYLATYNTTDRTFVTFTDPTSMTVHSLLSWSHGIFDEFAYFNGTVYCVAQSHWSAALGSVSSDYNTVTTLVEWNFNTYKWDKILVGNGGLMIIEGSTGTGPNASNGTRTMFTSAPGVSQTYGWLEVGVVTEDTEAAFAGGTFICGGYKAGSAVIFTTSTGSGAWSRQTTPGGITGIAGFCAFGSSILMIANNSADSTNVAYISNDGGASWSAGATMPALALPAKWGAPTYNGSEFICCAVKDTILKWTVSLDGVSWVVHSDAVVCGVNSPPYSPRAIVTWGLSSYWTVGKYLEGADSLYAVVPSTSTLQIDTIRLSEVVSAECLQSGLLTAGEIDVTELTSSVRGYVVGSVGAIRAALEPLQAAWPFDVRQHGYKVQFVARGGSSVVTIPAADLDARSGEAAPGVQITTRREMDSQLPRRVTINHVDPDREYNVCTQYAERLVTPAVNATVMDLSIVLTSTEAAGKAEVLLYLYWLERNDVTITLPATYLQLEPADVVTLVTPEGNISLRITDINYTSNALLEIKAKLANPAIYTPTAVGASPAVTGKTTIVAAGPAVYHLLDLPMISSHQTNPCFLVAMTGAQAGWRGGALMQSIDAGVSWVHVEDFDAPGATLGTASNALAAVDSRVIDAASVLSITLTQGTLSSVTQLGMFGGQNHFAYGAAGRWEIIAAQNCVLSSGQSYTLTGLLRGRFGTEWTMATHVNGDAIVLLDPIELARISVGSGTIGISYLYRGITVNRDISTDTDRAFAYQAVNLKPFAPISLTGSIDPTTADWSLSWIRRTRDGGEWRDNVDAAIGELLEAYQIDVFADGSYAVIKRTMSSNTPAVTYLSADQVADFGANQTTLYLSIYQLSATVGRGYGLTTSITR